METSQLRTAARFTAAILALGLGACSGSPAPSPLPNQSGSSNSSVRSLQPPAPVFHVFTAGSTPGFLSTAAAWDVAPGAKNSVWFTDSGTPAIGTISSAGKVHEYTTGFSPYARPYSIVAENNGTGWFTDPGNASIGRITNGGAIEEFTNAKLSGTNPQDITVAPDHSVWFISVGPQSYLGSAGAGGISKLFALSAKYSYDGSLIADRNGDLWFMATNANGRAILMQRHSDGTIVHHYTELVSAFEPCCPNLAAKRFAIGPDGNVWFTMLDYIRGNSPANWIVTLNSSGFQYFYVRNGKIDYPAYPSGITTAGERMWFTGDDPFQVNGGLWSLGTDGTMVSYPVPYNPLSLTADGAGNLWFTTHFGGNASQIVKATLP